LGIESKDKKEARQQTSEVLAKEKIDIKTDTLKKIGDKKLNDFVSRWQEYKDKAVKTATGWLIPDLLKGKELTEAEIREIESLRSYIRDNENKMVIGEDATIDDFCLLKSSPEKAAELFKKYPNRVVRFLAPGEQNPENPEDPYI